MKNYKVCVYAITLNEEKFVSSWVKSMNEADKIFVLDTGSTDNTVDLLKQLGVHVITKKYDTWRFDVARNDALSFVDEDTDICVCTDLDERFSEGWRCELENIWNDSVNRVSYNYNWSFDEYGNPATTFYLNKIHDRNNYEWIHPVHEVLKYKGNKKENIITCDSFELSHYQDFTKSRKSYLSLLELSVKEDPLDDRNMHYLGREYMYYKKWNKSITTLQKHLSLKSSTWKDERNASMRFIGRCYENMNRIEEARMWFKKSIKEAPYMREGYVELAFLEYYQNNYKKAKKELLNALKIENKSKSYLNEMYCWDGTIEDLLSICEFQIGNIQKSYEYVLIALHKKPNDKRIMNNKQIIEEYIQK